MRTVKEKLPKFEQYDKNNAKSHDPMGKESSNYIDSRISVTFENPDEEKRKEKPTINQNYLNMNDIVVPLLLKQGDDGQLYFAMEYTYIPARKQIYLELPSIGLEEKKDRYNESDVIKSVSKLANYLQLKLHWSMDPEKNKKRITIDDLTSQYDPVSQSFTNQTAKLVELGVENEQGDKRLHWFPVSCLQDLLSRDIPMSIQTKYTLLQFAQKHKTKFENLEQTEANIDKELINLCKVYGNRDDDRNIWPHKYRFGVAEDKIPGIIQDYIATGKIECASENFRENEKGIIEETSVYGMSKDSVQVVITRVKNGKVQVGLSKQTRSPFISTGNEIFEEIAAGMIDEKDYQNIDIKSDEYKNLDYANHYAGRNAAAREVSEETGIKILPDSLISLSQDLLLSHGTEELSQFYLAKLPENYIQGKQNLDAEESISEITWYDLDTLDIDKLHAPMPTKIALFMARNHIQKEPKLNDKSLSSNNIDR